MFQGPGAELADFIGASASSNCFLLRESVPQKATRREAFAMLINEMTEDECRDMLARVNYGRLACARDNQPYVVPIYFSFDGQHLYGFSVLGQKIEWMRANPLVCLQVDESESREHWTSVIVFGRYEELPDVPEFSAERAHAQNALQERSMWWGYTAVPGAEWRRKTGPFVPVVYRIHIDKVTGHRAAGT